MYIDKLDDIFHKYNNTYHSTIKMKNQIKIGIMINVDVSVKNIMYVKEMIFGILLQVIVKRENI